MFTGIIETVGTIEEKRGDSSGNGVVWEIKAPFSDELKIGESVSVNGICHTVTATDEKTSIFTVFSSLQTLSITGLQYLKKNDPVNLERSLRMGDRLSGHIVYGHGDGVAEVSEIESFDSSHLITLKLMGDYDCYLVKKGSVALDGISLTIYDKGSGWFQVMIIEHTYGHTNVHHLKKGSFVNLELDVIGKYVENFFKRG